MRYRLRTLLIVLVLAPAIVFRIYDYFFPREIPEAMDGAVKRHIDAALRESQRRAFEPEAYYYIAGDDGIPIPIPVEPRPLPGVQLRNP